MGRQTAGVVPTAETTASSCSSGARVFTPVFPVDHVSDPESGATSSACYREDGQEYVSHLPSSMRSIAKCDILSFACRAVEVRVASASHGIEEPAPAQPNETAVASPAAFSGTSRCMPCDLHPWLHLAACPQCRAHPLLRPLHGLSILQVRRSTVRAHGDPSSELRSRRETTAN